MNFENCDALEYLLSLEKNSVNLCLTDPPYAISRETNFSSGNITGKDTDRFRVSYDFGDWDKVDLCYFSKLFKTLYSVLTQNGTCIVWYDLWKIQELKVVLETVGFKKFRLIEWVKTNPVPINSKVSYLSNAKEYAIVCGKGSNSTFNSSYNNGVFQYPIYQGKDRFHPTQKSLQLFEELVKIHTDEQDVVLDMFAGSGTTLLAAKNTNRKFLGCELDKDFYEKTKERLNV
jgi:site-specific DNA-methyltransferase (adenine-specific)